MDELNLFDPKRPTAKRPLLGMTVLVVEDSRYACEALRLMCLRSGARIRRADSLTAAARHLKVYRPSAVIIDIGLPDGPGEQLIEDLAKAEPRVNILLGMSGDDGMKDRAMAAGADGFLSKPIVSLAAFQETMLAAMPSDALQLGPRVVSEEVVEPDISAYRDDINFVSEVLSERQDGPTLDYVAQFLTGVARSANDKQLIEAASILSETPPGEGRRRAQASHILQLVNERLQNRLAI
ncbi:MAG: response regulator [Pseudomonadota bacterium]